ncbi:hypothetical protein [Halomarina oriensis]|uniref:Uncharacterized protein n=1 Tax=Halomarina oriensis TaxID=671145 RepID=A0A6B0GT49_9EURY|nr:hypothetical protein [Halomarina oriensis]MWG36537.1 hypothetical protein [Halomarina oriensis]
MTLTHCRCGAPLVVAEAVAGETRCDACRGDRDRLRACSVCQRLGCQDRVRRGVCHA